MGSWEDAAPGIKVGQVSAKEVSNYAGGGSIVTIGAESKCQVGFCTPIEIAPTSVWGGVMSPKRLTRNVSILGGSGV